MLENGMIVGAWRHDPQQQPLQICPVCLEDVGELIQTSEGWMCPDCADDLVEANEAEFAPEYIAERRLEYLEGLLDWAEGDERRGALEAACAYLVTQYPDVADSYTKAFLKDNRYELRELVKEEMGVQS